MTDVEGFKIQNETARAPVVQRLTFKGMLRTSLHESGSNYNPDRSHSVSVETIGIELYLF